MGYPFGPFRRGLVAVFSVSTALGVIAVGASLRRGGRYVQPGIRLCGGTTKRQSRPRIAGRQLGSTASCIRRSVSGFAVTLIPVILDSALTLNNSTICSRPAGA